MFISSSNRASRPAGAGATQRYFRLITVFALAGAAFLATASPGPARERTDAPQKVQRALDEVVDAGAPGAIALVRVGARTYRLSSGYGNLAPLTPIRVSDRSRIGGVTKSFTATVVLQLVGERKLALDDTVEQWLPGVISNGEAITIRSAAQPHERDLQLLQRPDGPGPLHAQET